MRSRLPAVAVALLFLTACGGGGDAPPAQAGSQPVAQASAPADPQFTDPRGEIFVVKGCPQCHSISALGVKSPAEIGPDLTLAYEDVQTRFGMKLEDFLANPTGTMQVVLSAQITLSPAERDSIHDILEDIHHEAVGDNDDD
jgi:mono/diheme cytochrome c family protein